MFGPADPRGSLRLELPLVDAPFNGPSTPSFPSMGQSLAITVNAYSLMHAGLAWLADPWSPDGEEQTSGIVLEAVADLLTVSLPPFLSWQHEEWHRAVMSNREISSFNDVYNFKIFADVIAVSHVKDEDLVRLKAMHPADQVRLSTAGIEGNYELAYALERQTFFDDSPAFHVALLWLLYAQNSAYLDTCASAEVDRLTDEWNVAEGADVPRRDFTGADCTAWVYDLFRPDEPYQARGVHPSGVGIDRYRSRNHLTAAERSYLQQQVWLSLLNVLDPNLFALRGFAFDRGDGSPPLWLNFAVRHLPTSFGYVIRGDLFLRRAAFKLLGSLQGYVSDRRWVPGLDAQLFDYPLSFPGRRRVALSARLALWLQPERQRYDATAVAPGGLAGLRLGWALHPRVEPFVDLEVKTAGWVAGNVSLGRSLGVRAGLMVTAF